MLQCNKVIARKPFRPANWFIDSRAWTKGRAGAASLREDARMANLAIQLRDYRLTTAEILYHLPDHPALLQSYIWQDYDIAPRFPVLHGFLDFWTRKIEGKLHSVKVASRGIVSAAELRLADAEF